MLSFSVLAQLFSNKTSRYCPSTGIVVVCVHIVDVVVQKL